MSKVGPCSESPQVWRLWAFIRQRRLAEEALRAVSSPWSWSVLFRLMQNLHTNFDKKFCRLQKKKKNSEALGTRWMLYGTVCYRFSRHIIVVCSYMPPIWLFCICCGKVNGLSISKIVGLKSMIFFLIESSNWMAYIACWCEHFVRCKKKQMTGFGGKKRFITVCLK